MPVHHDDPLRLPGRPELPSALRRALESGDRDAVPGDAAVDAAILRRVLDGDPNAFGELVARYQRRAYWVALHLVGRAEDARDIVQDAFVRVHRSLERFDFGRNFYTWFYRIVTNLAIDALRKRRTARAITLDAVQDNLSTGRAPSDGIELDEVRSSVWSVLDGLDDKFRSVLVLRDIHGLSCREIAPILGVTHATVRWRLHRGRQLFREQWERVERREEGA